MQTACKRLVFPRFILFFVATTAAAQPLADNLQKRISHFPGAVSLYAKNLETGAAVGIRESEPVRTATLAYDAVTLVAALARNARLVYAQSLPDLLHAKLPTVI